MATSRIFAEYILDQCMQLPVRVRPMMGEYILYYRDKYAACICDNRMLVKDVAAARILMPEAQPEAPYEGAKGMLPVERLEDREFLAQLLEAVYRELPAPRARKAKVKKHD